MFKSEISLVVFLLFSVVGVAVVFLEPQKREWWAESTTRTDTPTDTRMTEMQVMEMEMVEGMYSEHFERLGDDPLTYSVAFSASPDAPIELKLTVSYTDPAYPEEGGVPALVVDNVSKERRIQTDKLAAELQAMAVEHSGMHCVVVMLQRCQEFLTTLAEEEDRAALQKRGDAMSAASTEKVVIDPTIRMGNAISRELFLAWQTKHLADKKAAKMELMKKFARESASKLTGRQLWDSTLRNADWELFGAEGDGEAVDLDDAGFEYEFDEENVEDEGHVDGGEDSTA